MSVISLPTPLHTMPLPDLESELLGLAGHIAAAECRFLHLLAEFDQRNGWAGDGIRSCAHWLSWRAGMSLRTASEHLRVAHALRNLPRITDAFAAGKPHPRLVRRATRPRTDPRRAATAPNQDRSLKAGRSAERTREDQRPRRRGRNGTTG